MTYYGKVRGATSGGKWHIWAESGVPLCGRVSGAHGQPPKKRIENRPASHRMCAVCEASEDD